MFLSDNSASSVNACANSRQTDFLASKGIHDARLYQIAKTEQNTVIVLRSILRLPKRPFMPKHFALSRMVIAT